MPAFLESATHAAIVPPPLSQSFARLFPLAVHELPYPTTRFTVAALWHERHQGDASQNWLHEAVRRATESLRS